MLVPAWKVATWKPVVSTRHQFDENVSRFSHLGTSVQRETPHDGLLYGQVVWGTRTNDGMVALAWDWIEVKESVIAIADPMLIVSNVHLVDDDGCRVAESARILCMNNAIHGLGWQRELTQLRRVPEHALAA